MNRIDFSGLLKTYKLYSEEEVQKIKQDYEDKIEKLKARIAQVEYIAVENGGEVF